jgi:geranylgeranylglycerol-phosphate geranylgeranyltransferase
MNSGSLSQAYFKAKGLARLYRIDAFLIIMLGYICPSLIFGLKISIQYFVQALFISGISVNFIYSLNSIMDVEIDRINKSFRPLISGIISINTAKTYCFILLIISVFYPWFLFENNISVYSTLIFPVIGLLYSNKFFPFKKILILSAILTSSLLVLPIIIGMLESGLFSLHFYFPLCVFLYCLGVVPLKDIEDKEGDKQFNSQNWANSLGDKKLIYFSVIYLLIIGFIGFVLFSLFILSACYSNCSAIIYFIFIK